jgi:PAS domain S-box-containing protein
MGKNAINQIKIVANILANVMQRKTILNQIAEEKEWSEAVLEGMPQLAYVFDLQGRMKRWNKNFEDVTGFSAEELKDKFLGEFHNDEGRERAMAAIQKVIEDGQERSVEHLLIRKNGEILPHYYGSGKLVEIGGELYIAGQAVNISEIKLAQEKFPHNWKKYKASKIN